MNCWAKQSFVRCLSVQADNRENCLAGRVRERPFLARLQLGWTRIDWAEIGWAKIGCLFMVNSCQKPPFARYILGGCLYAVGSV
jgi:hypothetical protein